MGLIRNLLSKDALKNIKVAFRRIENELNDHLEGINANTNEIQSVYEVLTEVESKLEKLTDRVESLEIKLDAKQKRVIDLDIAPLTKSEKEVFFALYMEASCTYEGLAQKTEMPEVMVQEYITNLIAKGIPIVKRYKQNKMSLSLDQEFKEMQAKEKIIGLTER